MKVAEQLLCDGCLVKAVVDLRFGSLFPLGSSSSSFKAFEILILCNNVEVGSELSDSRNSTDVGAGKWISGEPSQS
ncbi:hypothetical protein M8C21_017187 [Ambrosia artemisiifolia]|uniref:Uncharacterized protein n=1 Tax=Ambrosia artemisiifolia TaxID=4212 RepID=A0AAD5C3Z6_AMBAR|nr:hypothetical protein M8C21_017187 [Ambrosia artemisiifolia]